MTKINKVTSGSTPETAKTIDDLYRSIIAAGTHPVSSPKSPNGVIYDVKSFLDPGIVDGRL